ncbi:MAG: hypothetical protein ABSG33_09680 [Candidatus Bathyarchaeia archaeon]
MPIKILQCNDRVAEVQFICDDCGKLMRTCVVPAEEAKAQDSKRIVCCQCKHGNTM